MNGDDDPLKGLYVGDTNPKTGKKIGPGISGRPLPDTEEPPPLEKEGIGVGLFFCFIIFFGYSEFIGSKLGFSGYSLTAFAAAFTLGFPLLIYTVLKFIINVSNLRYGKTAYRIARGCAMSFLFVHFLPNKGDELFIPNAVVGFVIGCFFKELIIVSVCGGILWYFFGRG